MELQPGIAAAASPVPLVEQAAEMPSLDRFGPTTVLRLATWTGLVAGWFDLGLLVVKRWLIDGEFYRLGEHFVWIVPAAVVVLLLFPGIVLALIARMRRDGVHLGLAVAILAFVGFFDICARLPLELWAALILSGGLAIQSARLVASRRPEFIDLLRWTTPLLIGALLAAVLVKVGGRAWWEHQALASLRQPSLSARNVLLIVWDTVRAGNLSLHGYIRRTTPYLERGASRGARFDLAFATSSWTLPSHASLFTGRWPQELGADWRSPLRPDVPTLAEYLGASGYDTGGFVANLDYRSRETGLARGFAHYEDFPSKLYDVFARFVGIGHRMEFPTWACFLEKLVEKISGRPCNLDSRSTEHVKSGAEVNRAFLEWLSWQEGRSRPFFAFLNYNDAHSPYEVPDRATPGFGLRPATCRDRLTLSHWNGLEKANLTDHDVRMAIDVYDDCISYLDRLLGLLLDELEHRGVLDHTLVIVTADHGEHLGDHLLFFHGCSLYLQLVQVPLVIVDPKGQTAGRIVAKPVSLRDVPTTIADLVGLGQDARFPGQSLARFWTGEPKATRLPSEPLLMETSKPILLTNQGREPAAKGPMKSLIAGGMHYIRSGDDSEELYALRTDPEERLNLAGAPMARELLQRFRDSLTAMVRKR
jgi:arylsulfatase A-like enzyme